MTYSANLSFFATKTSDTGAINSGIDGVPIGANTASTGKFTSVTNTGLTSGRVTYAGTSGLLSDSANFTFNGTELILGAANPSFQGSSSTGSATLLNNSGGAFVRVYGGSHATRANYTDFINASSTSTFTSGGYLGINNTSPITNLDVVNSSASGTGAVTTVRLNHAGTTVGDGPRLLFTSGTSTTGGCAIAGYGTALNAADMLFYAGGNTERMRIDSSGNVGIGTSSPASKLHVSTPNGGVQVRATSDSDVSFFALSSGADSSAFVAVANDARQWTMRVNGAESDQFQLRDSTAGANRLVVNSSGDVGIGTSSPSSFSVGGSPILVVGNNAQTQITLYGGSSVGDINFATSSSGVGLYSGVVRYDGTSNFMSFWTSSTERMRINSSGNVGIGTTDPQAKLTVKGQTHTAPWFAAERSSSTTLQFKIVGAENTGYTASTGTVSAPWTNVIDNNNSDFMISTLLGGGTGGNIILDGKVGIGTTSPSTTLDVNGAITALGGNTPSTGGFKMRNVAGTVTPRLTSDGGDGTIIRPGASGAYVAVNNYANSLNLFYITDAGNVGIGISSPSYKLHVLKSSGGILSRFDSTSDGITDIYGYGLEITRSDAYIKSSGVLHLGSSHGYSTIYIDTSGRVGIGTTDTANFGRKFLVNGTGGFNNDSGTVGIGFNRGLANTYGYIGTGNWAVNYLSNADFGISSGSTGALVFGTASGTERMRIDSSGNVGIGLTSYTGKLAVNGVIATYASSDNNYRGSMDVEAGNLRLIAPPYASNPTNITFCTGTSSTERMRIDSSGNVGIGTSSPANKLDVYTNSATTYAARIYNNNAYGGLFLQTSSVSSSTYNLACYNSASYLFVVRDDGNVGIGTTTPTSLLTMAGTTPQLTFNNSVNTGAQGVVFQYAGTDYGQITLNVQSGEMRIKSGGSSGYFTTFYTDSAERMRIDSSGTLILKNNPTGNALQFWGSGGSENARIGINGTSLEFHVNETSSARMVIDSSGNLTIAGTFTESSTIRVKENIRPITGALDKVCALNGIIYDKKDGSAKDEPGLIAEEVYKVIKDLVVLDDEGKPAAIKYTKTVAYLVEAIKELKDEMDLLKGTAQNIRKYK